MATAIDPVCQMEVDTDNPPGGQSEHQGETYYFCAAGCRVAFDKEPEKYLAAPAASGGHDHGDHGHGHEHGGHGHGHAPAAPTAKPGFFARLFGRK